MYFACVLCVRNNNLLINPCTPYTDIRFSIPKRMERIDVFRRQHQTSLKNKLIKRTDIAW